MSMLVYLRHAIGIWKRYPLALTLPLVAVSWLTLLANSLAQHLSRGLRATIDLCVFALCCVASYTVYTFIGGVVRDGLEGHTPDWLGAVELCRQPSTFRTSLGLFWRLLLWFLLALFVGLVLEGLGYEVATVMHHPLAHGALRRPFVWFGVLTLAVCVTQYGFAIPYLAFSKGAVASPISLSVARTKPILRPLIGLTICWAVATLSISEFLRLISMHWTFAAQSKHEWDMLRGATQSVPNAWWVIAVTLIAYQDWLAMNDGLGLQIDNSRAGEKAG